jgi:alanine dehydrogenase
MPGAVPITSTYALTNATLPYVLSLADRGVEGAIARDPGLRPGVNVAAGKVTHEAVAEGVGAEYVPVEQALGLERADNGKRTASDQQVYAATIETEED